MHGTPGQSLRVSAKIWPRASTMTVGHARAAQGVRQRHPFFSRRSGSATHAELAAVAPRGRSQPDGGLGAAAGDMLWSRMGKDEPARLVAAWWVARRALHLPSQGGHPAIRGISASVPTAHREHAVRRGEVGSNTMPLRPKGTAAHSTSTAAGASLPECQSYIQRRAMSASPDRGERPVGAPKEEEDTALLLINDPYQGTGVERRFAAIVDW